MKPDMEKIIQVLISLIEEQEHVKIEYTLEKRTTQQPNALNGWDIRSVSVDLPDAKQGKPYWIRAGAMVIGFILVMLAWYLVFGY